MNTRFAVRLLSIVAALAAPWARAANPMRSYETARLSQPAPSIDGKLDDSVWRSPEGWEGGFVQYAPHEGAPASQTTRFKIVYDRDNLYAAIQCYDDPSKVRRVFAPRDDEAGDLAGFAFDSYHNRQTAYEFDLTAAGQKHDVMYLPGANNYDANWNPVWDGAVAVDDSGWAAEFRIPFSQLRYHDIPDQTWGLHVWRVVNRLREESHWNLMPSTATSGPQNFGTLKGLSGIRGSRQTELLPYASLKLDRDGAAATSEVAPKAGVDAKMGISSDFTLDATVNPDFGQIEGDPAELNLTAYETYFDEKRPFFLEGTDIFDYTAFSVDGNANKLFYSRRIGADDASILASGKLTGRTRGGLSVGALETVTGSDYGAVADDGQGHRALTRPYANFFAGRVRQESEDGNTHLGLSVNSVSRNLDGYGLDREQVSWANTAGLDFKQELSDKLYYYQANLFGSYLTGSKEAITLRQQDDLHGFQRPGASHLRVDSSATSLSGEGGTAEIGKQGGFFQFWVNGSAWSPGLDVNDIGYMKETDRLYQEVGGFIWDNRPFWISNFIRAGGSVNNGWTFGGEHVDTKYVAYVWSKLKNLWEIYLETGHMFPSLDTRRLRGGPALLQDGYQWNAWSVTTDLSKRLWAKAHGEFDFNADTDYLVRGAGLKLAFNPIDRLSFSADAYYEEDDLPDEFFGAILPDNAFVVGKQERRTLSLTLRAAYYITPKISFQYYGNPYLSAVDFMDFRKVADASSEDRARRFAPLAGADAAADGFDNPDEDYGEFRSNFVFRWEYRAGSFLYLVWSHAQSRDDYYDAPELKALGGDLFDRPSRDVVMAKVSYWLNL